MARVQAILGVNLSAVYDPADAWHPWINHWFPGVGREQMADLTLSQIVEMHDFVQHNTGD